MLDLKRTGAVSSKGQAPRKERTLGHSRIFTNSGQGKNQWLHGWTFKLPCFSWLKAGACAILPDYPQVNKHSEGTAGPPRRDKHENPYFADS
jgi:hypothetical protein